MATEIERVVELCLSRRGEGLLDIPARRHAFDAREELGAVAKDVAVTTVTFDGIAGEWLTPRGARGASVLLYLHGGGYCWGSLDSHRPLVSALAREAMMPALVVDYRRAPEHPYPAALDDAMAAYRWLITQHPEMQRVAIAGDSAGGGLTLATLLALRDAGDALPRAALAISPWTDLTCASDAYRSRAELDPICSHDMLAQLSALYRGDADAANPYLSPLFGDFKGLPPLLVQVGEAEVLYDDSALLVERARSHGVDVEFESVPEMVHVWHLFASMLTPGREAIERAGAFLARRLNS